MQKIIYVFLAVSLFLTILSSCQEEPKKTTIILSKASLNYIKWIEAEDVIILDAYTIKNTDSILDLADGIILTGGEDINPLEYNDTSNIKLCGKINFRRDTLERKLFDFAFNNKLPLIGVCRGMQMMNVAMGGTLYGDIPTQLGTGVIHRNKGEVMHEIVLCDTSSMKEELSRVGFNINIEKDSIIITGVPSECMQENLQSIIENLIEQEKNSESLETNHNQNLALSLAKSLAIKKVKALDKEEIMSLKNELFKCEFPSVCPNGKRTMIQLKTSEIEKYF